MFAVLGITGQVGGAVARALLDSGESVRAVVRSEGKGRPWAELGCNVAIADMDDADAVERALQGVQGAFVMLPSNFDPEDGFPDTIRTVDALCRALEAARLEKIVCLSTIGAQADETNLLSKFQYVEARMGALPSAVTFLRAAWFMENATRDIKLAAETGVIASYLQPLDRRVPMVSTEDVGQVAAEILSRESWAGSRIVELESSNRVSPDEIASTLSKLLGRSVRAKAVPRETWEARFRAQGAANPQLRIRMLDGFNEGWIEFEHGPAGSRKSSITLEAAFERMVKRLTGHQPL
ncbi:NmrA family transcriptional regulator [Burkholderia sp. WAC0059]|uniref:NmrA family NAD(P)-binding protein n=1 Tax=Burkholderia sp. WAC0059 TaxID=2066022 RepID=UPI000C7F457B|nr:NmrA family NAD(P)-binding protein [Burkholderia sp. WAC0059]PLZ00952.1 NmrA family transcriptional regulator [Burkholderia sp. WAC0059]